MLRPLSRRLFTLLLPLLLLCGGGPGRWLCADGVPCETATAVACCCGCPESGASIEHQCQEHGAAPSLAAEPCGCYYERQHVQARGPAGAAPVQHPAALPSARRVLSAPPARIVFRAAPAATGSPPRYLLSPRDTRGPPVA